MTSLIPTIKFIAFANEITVQSEKAEEFLLLDGDCDQKRMIRVKRCRDDFASELYKNLWLPCNIRTQNGNNRVLVNTEDACKVLKCDAQKLLTICKEKRLALALHQNLPNQVKARLSYLLLRTGESYAKVLPFAYKIVEKEQTVAHVNILTIWKITISILPSMQQNMTQAVERAIALQDLLPNAELSQVLLVNQIALAIFPPMPKNLEMALKLKAKAESLNLRGQAIPDFAKQLNIMACELAFYLGQTFEQTFAILSSNREFQHLRSPKGTIEIYQKESSWDIFLLQNKCRRGHQLIGAGTYATVKICQSLLTQNIYCRISDRRKSNIDVLKVLAGHRGIVDVKFIASQRYASKKNPTVTKQALIEKLYTNDLREYQLVSTLTTKQKKKIALDVLHGLNHMHLLGIVHNDLKDTNILIKIEGDDCEGVIGDFNLSSYVSSARGGGTKAFLAPEWLNHHCFQGPVPFDFYAKDIYALGITLLRLFSDELGSSPINRFNTLNEMLTGAPFPALFEQYMPYPKPLDTPLAYFIYKLLRFFPKDRLSAPQALAEFQRMIALGEI